MAGVLNLPVVFTVQNNQFAYSSPNETEFGTPNVADRGAGYGIPSLIIDGNDIYDVLIPFTKHVKMLGTVKVQH